MTQRNKTRRDFGVSYTNLNVVQRKTRPVTADKNREREREKGERERERERDRKTRNV